MNDPFENDRVPPFDIKAEQSLLGCIFLKPELIKLIPLKLRANDFYFEKHRIIFTAMLEVDNECQPIDVVTIGTELLRKDIIHKIGGSDAFTEIIDSVVTTAHVDAYSEIISQRAVDRQIIYAAQQIVANGFNRSEKTDDYASFSRKLMNDATSSRLSLKKPRLLSEKMDEVVEESLSGKPPENMVPTGFRAIDRVSGGLMRPLPHVIAGRPGMGKSMFSLNLGLNLSGNDGLPGIYFTMEDGEQFQKRRALSNMAGIDFRNIMMNRVRAFEEEKLRRAQSRMNNLPLWLMDDIMSAQEVCNVASLHAATHGLGYIIVDHLGYVKSNGEDEYTVTGSSMRTLCGLGKELDIPVIILVQLNRKVEERKDRRPILSDLRASGKIEEDARNVWFLYRDHQYNPDETNKHDLEVIIAKSSHGPTGKVDLWCDPSRMMVRDIENYRGDEPEYDTPAPPMPAENQKEFGY